MQYVVIWDLICKWNWFSIHGLYDGTSAWIIICIDYKTAGFINCMVCMMVKMWCLKYN